VLQQLEEHATTLWETERLQELKWMLDYNIGLELERQRQTRYMEIQKKECRNRPILLRPSDIATNFNKNKA